MSALIFFSLLYLYALALGALIGNLHREATKASEGPIYERYFETIYAGIGRNETAFLSRQLMRQAGYLV